MLLMLGSLPVLLIVAAIVLSRLPDETADLAALRQIRERAQARQEGPHS